MQAQLQDDRQIFISLNQIDADLVSMRDDLLQGEAHYLVKQFHLEVGVWAVLNRKSPIMFVAAEPKGSPYWFPDTPMLKEPYEKATKSALTTGE